MHEHIYTQTQNTGHQHPKHTVRTCVHTHTHTHTHMHTYMHTTTATTNHKHHRSVQVEMHVHMCLCTPVDIGKTPLVQVAGDDHHGTCGTCLNKHGSRSVQLLPVLHNTEPGPSLCRMYLRRNSRKKQVQKRNGHPRGFCLPG